MNEPISAKNQPPSDCFDGPWKLCIESYLPELLARIDPALHAAIDWSCGWTLLGNEVHEPTPKNSLRSFCPSRGKRRVRASEHSFPA